MPLKPCRECRKEVSTQARTCPQCGAQWPTEKASRVESANAVRQFAVIVFLAIALAYLLMAVW